jgi:DNA-binding MarR family transcriptional regulator
LRALADSDVALSVGELAHRTFLLGPSLSRMLVTLDRRSLVTRSAGIGDARRADLLITPLGLDLVSTIAPLSEAVYDRIENHLEDGDLGGLYGLLERVAQL